MRNIRVAKYLFFVVAAMDILGIALGESLLIYISKPFIIPALWLLYKLQVRKPSYFYSIALFCSFLGDTVLMFNGLNFFMLGLVSFLIAHVFYIVIIRKRIQKWSLSRFFKLGIPFLLLVVGLISLLESKGLETMLFPVIIYGVTIAVFGTIALYSYLELKNDLSKFMLIGAFLFIISDAILAINAFYEPMYWFSLIVMLTYIAAQFYIYKSMVIVKPTSTSDQ